MRSGRFAAPKGDGGRLARIQLVAATAAIVLSQTGVVVGLLWGVQPELRELGGIGRDHALVVKAVTRIRGELSALVRDASGALAHGTPPPDVRGTAARVRGTMASISPLADTARERALLDEMSRAVDELESSILGAQRGSPGSGPSRGPEPLGMGYAQKAAADQAAQALVDFNVEEVRSAADRVRSALVRIIVGGALAAALGTAAAVLLLRKGMAGLARQDAERETRWAELDAFAGRVAHELRTPLQTIELSLAALRGSTAHPDLAERGRKQVRALERTLRGLLEFSRAGGKPRPGGRAWVDEAIEWSMRDLDSALSVPGTYLERQVEPQLEVAMEPAHLRTVLVNLMQNSLRYGRSPEGARIRLTALRAGERVQFEVRDAGPGIAPEVAAHVFEPFVRGSPHPDGYGLGLPTVKRLIEAHGGAVQLESADGHGTAVRFVLPSPAASGPPPSAAAPGGPARA